MTVATYARTWYRRAIGFTDPLDRFISLWIALVVSGQPNSGSTGDTAIVEHWFKVRRDLLATFMNGAPSVVIALVARRGPGGGTIMDHPEPQFRAKMERVAGHFSAGPRLSDAKLTQHTATMLIAIRNNLFHGEKDPDLQFNIELVSLASELLVQLMQIGAPDQLA